MVIALQNAMDITFFNVAAERNGYRLAVFNCRLQWSRMPEGPARAYTTVRHCPNDREIALRSFFGSVFLWPSRRIGLDIAMPSALPKMALAKLKPTQEELDAARKILTSANEKELKSKRASMSAWLRQCADENNEVASSAGDQRRQFLEKFLILQMRAKAGQKKVVGSKEHTSANAKYRENRWMSEDKMDQELGKHKATEWRNSGLLVTRADRITGSTDRFMIEYQIPEDWARCTMEDLQKLKLETETADATEEDLRLVNQIDMADNQESTPAVKQEPLSKEEQTKQEIEQFKANCKSFLRRFQDYEVETKEMEASAKKQKVMEEML